MFSSCAERFFEFALSLFEKSGHTDLKEPQFTNHSAKQFIYFDFDEDLALSSYQRSLLKNFDNVSKLFTAQKIEFFSINLLSPKNDRSQFAKEIHDLIQFVANDSATICVFKNEDKFIFSFAGYGLSCILSDWFSLDDEIDNKILETIDIANMTIANSKEYFLDFVSVLARRYYFSNSEQILSELIPIDFYEKRDSTLTRQDLKDFLLEQKFSAAREYGDDYVEYDSIQTTELNFDDDIDSISDEIDQISEDVDQIPNEIDQNSKEIDQNSDEIDSAPKKSEYIQMTLFDEEDESDEIDLDEIDPSVFENPERLLEYIKSQNKNS